MSDQTLAAALSTLLPKLLTASSSQDGDDYSQRLLARAAAHNADAQKSSAAAIDARPKPQDINVKNTKHWLIELGSQGLKPEDVEDRNRLALQDAAMRDLAGPAEFIGPQQPQPWDNLSPADKLAADKQIEMLDQALLAKSGGAAGKFAPQLAKVEEMGGLTPEQALFAARYKMSKQGGLPLPAEAPPLPVGSKDKTVDDASYAEKQYNLLIRHPVIRPSELK